MQAPATISDADHAIATVSGLMEGDYSFRLTVTDAENAKSTDDVTVTVKKGQ